MNTYGINDRKIDLAVDKLVEVLRQCQSNETFIEISNAQNEVLQRYQPIFERGNIRSLSTEDFLSFLQYKNNRHWTNLYRQQKMIISNLDGLKNALELVLDESKTISDRLDLVQPHSGNAYVKGLGKAILTPILLISYPDKYGVWNGTSKAGLESVGLWPDFERGLSFGTKYQFINEILIVLAKKLEIDLWTLDGLWWFIESPDKDDEESDDLVEFSDADVHASSGFGLEKYLQEFIFDNWGKIETLADWDLYTEEGDIVGVEYDTRRIGRIDLLTKHKSEPKWLVIELKRAKSSDKTLGQIQRYMGWVDEHLAEENDEIHGMIISHSADERLGYALKFARNVSYLLYEVKFDLKQPAGQ